jgi:hypothetical protein
VCVCVCVCVCVGMPAKAGLAAVACVDRDAAILLRHLVVPYDEERKAAGLQDNL